MIKTLKCKKCSNSITIDYSKSSTNEFTIACPSCSQKYKFTKPKESTETTKPISEKSTNTNIKTIPCPKCKTNLGVDLSRIQKFPAIVICKKCNTKLKINQPNIKPDLTKNNLDKLKREPSQVKFDKSKINPKNNWAYTLYYYTSRINYLNKVTLFIYLTYLVRSITKTLSSVDIEKIDLESFVKLKAEANALSINIFNTVVNPVLKENGISPRLVSWATSWFIKKVSARIVLNVLNYKNVDKNLPYIKQHLEADGVINFDFKSIVNKIIENKYLFLAISFVPVLALYSELNMFYGGGITSIIFPWLFFIIIPGYVLLKAKSKSITYIYAIGLVLILSHIIDYFFSIYLSFNFFGGFDRTKITDYIKDFLVNGISLILFLLMLSYFISLLLNIDTFFKDKAMKAAFIKKLFLEKSKIVIISIIIIGIVFFISRLSYKLITTHEPTDEEKQQVIAHYEPLYTTNWVAVSDNITYPLEFSVPNIIKTESADGGKIYYEFSATFGGVKMNTSEEVVVPSQISNLPNSFVLSRWGSYLTHRLISENWSNDSIVGYVDELDGTRDMNIEKKISFVAYTKYFYEKRQQLIAKEFIADAAKNKSLLEGSYLNQTSNNGYQYTSFVEFKTNSNNLLEMLSGSADGDVSYDPTFTVLELKNLNDRIYALGKYDWMTEEDEMIEMGYFSYNTSLNNMVFTYQNGTEFKKQNNQN